MENFDFQDLLSSANARIEKANRQKALDEQRNKEQIRLRTEELALSITKILFKILDGIDRYCGEVEENDLECISKYGVLSKSTWNIDDSGLQIYFDFSYSFSKWDCAPFYRDSRPSGFDVSSVNLEYLCEILKKYNIKVGHEKEVDNEDVEMTYITDKLIIALNKTKKIQNDSGDIEFKKKL